MSALEALARRDGAPLPKAVKTALDAMRASPEHPFDLAALAALSDTPARTLQRQFASFLGKGPLEALRDLRFEAARRLLQSAPANARVADLAARCGLTHLGRFSVEYRRRYGETPSQTLSRRGAVAPVLASKAPRTTWRDDRPTIAVLPVEADPSDRALAEGVAEALASALGRTGLAVTANAPSARYHLAGAYRTQGLTGRLAYRLVDRESGRLIWAHRHEGASDDAFLLEDNLAARVASAVRPGLRAAEVAHARAMPDRDAGPYDLAMRALPYVLAFAPNSTIRALDLLDRALAADPDHPLAAALAAWAHGQRIIYSFTPQPEGETAPAVELARRAMSVDDDATVLSIAGAALAAAHDLETAQQAIGRALEADGGSAWAWGRGGWLSVYRGDARAAIGQLITAIELAPHDPLVFNYCHALGCAHFGLGQYADAVAWFERGIAEQPSSAWAHRMMAPAQLLAGRPDKARRSLDQMQGLYPDLTISQVTSAIPLPAATLSKVADALQSLGVER